MPDDGGRPATLFGGVLGRGRAADEVGDAAWLRALLDVEAGLATACARAGLVGEQAAAAVRQACAEAGGDDLRGLGADAAAAGNPVVPLVRVLERRAGAAGSGAVHLGATSQDVLDSAMVLVARRAGSALLVDVRAAADAAAALAAEHRDTVAVGRTLLQQAVPTTFGLKAAGWALALDAAAAHLEAAADALPVQLGGAVGTLALYGDHAEQVVAALADVLGLRVPVLPWHTARGPLADLAGALGSASGALGKTALDLVLLAQTEVGEVREGAPGRGGSSTMPHKRNPVAAVSARAAALRAPGLVATLLTATAQEHERAAGAWHAEWEALSDLLRSTGSAASWLRDALEHLEVDAQRMAANLAGAGELGAEALAGALAPSLGRGDAHELVAAAVRRSRASGRSLATEVAADPACALDAAHLTALARPDTGQAGPLVDRALAARPSRPDPEEPPS